MFIMFNQRKKLLCLLYLKRRYLKKKTYCKRNVRCWIRPIFRNRLNQGAYHNLMKEMILTDMDKFVNYLRMTPEQFHKLCEIVGPHIEKLYVSREPISAAERIASTLRFLASGDSMISISYQFRIGATTVSNIILETCLAIWDSLKDKVFPVLATENWVSISEEFFDKWNFPHCIGAIDGKHVHIQAPPHSGSTFYNYKGTHSMVLLAMCDASYKFTTVDIGAQGRQSDGGIFKGSTIANYFENSRDSLPVPTPLLPGGPKVPYVIVGDAAFQLSKYMMKPFPGTKKTDLTEEKEIFNYRLSRARRVIENAFGILASKWRIYRKPIIAKLETAEAIIQATVVLHNFLLQEEQYIPVMRRTYCHPTLTDREESDGKVVDGEWRSVASALTEMKNDGSRTHSRSVAQIRNYFKDYFLTDEGAVTWQWDRVRNKAYY